MSSRNQYLVGNKPGFTLIGLVITLTIMATVSGMAGFYYMQVLEDRKIVMARNELDAIAKHVRLWLIERGYPTITTDSLDFLVEDDKLVGKEVDGRVAIWDPWGNEYKIDPVAGCVYSDGIDTESSDDDIRVPYTRSIDQQSLVPLTHNEDTVPPLIMGNTPTGIIRYNTPVVRASFVDHYGGVIDAGSVKMWIADDAGGNREVHDIEVAGEGVVESSAGAITYTTNDKFRDGQYTVVVQVADGQGNLARREWSFIIDTEPAVVRLLSPEQGQLYKEDLTISWEIKENRYKRWWIEWDHREFDGGQAIDPVLGEDIDLTGAAKKVKVLDTLVPTNPANSPLVPEDLADGLHYITLRLEDATGRIYSDQVEILLDNTPPIAYITSFHYGAGSIIATDVPVIVGWARDPGGQVQTFEYFYTDTSGDSYPSTGYTTAAPIDYDGTPPGNWMALYNSTDEEWSTTGSALAVTVGGYENTTVPMGQIVFHGIAKDLAGNVSPVVSHTFVVDMFAGGISDPVFIDSSFPGGPTVAEPYRHITGLTAGQLSNCSFPSYAQTTGVFRFTCKQNHLSGWWEVVVDDYQAGTGPGSDGVYDDYYDSSGSLGSIPCDWTSTGSNAPPTSTPRISDIYGPHLDLEVPPPVGIVNDSTRRAAAGNLPEAWYMAKVSYYNPGDLVPREALTGFFIDNHLPLITELTYQDAGGNLQILTENLEISHFSQGTGSGYQVHFGGTVTDTPSTTGIIPWVRYVIMRKTATDPDPSMPAIYPDEYSRVFPQPADWISCPPANPCTFGISAVFASENPMQVSSGSMLGLDGNYRMWVVAEDGAGLTTHIVRNFSINCVGPLVDYVMFENVPPPSNLVTYATTTTVEPASSERRLLLSFQVRDELPLGAVQYRIIPIRTPAVPMPLPVNLAGVSGTVHTETNLLLTNDSLGSEFEAAPTSYELQVWGLTSGGIAGPVLRAKITFNFLMSLAIVAPNFSYAGNARIVDQAEQIEVANYLFDNITAVQNKVIYNYECTHERAEGFSGAVPDLMTWLSNSTATGSTDVLVVLDQMAEDLAPGAGDMARRFYESDADNDGDTDADPDADAIVWMGAYPFSSYLNKGGGNKGDMVWTVGSSTNQQLKAFYDFLDMAPPGDNQADGFAFIDEASEGVYQEIHPALSNRAGRGNLYLPSLSSHYIGEFLGITRALRHGYNVHEGDTLGNSTLLKSFTVASSYSVGDSDGDNFVLEHNDSHGLFANFFSYAPNVGISDYATASNNTSFSLKGGLWHTWTVTLSFVPSFNVASIKVEIDIDFEHEKEYWMRLSRTGLNDELLWTSKLLKHGNVTDGFPDHMNGNFPDDYTPYHNPQALNMWSGQDSAGDWKLQILANGNDTADNDAAKFYSCTLHLYGDETDVVRNRIDPAPYVIREFIEGYLLNRGFPAGASRRICYSADDDHQGDATPVGSGNNTDCYYYPNETGGWQNITPSDVNDAKIQSMSPDGNTILFTMKDSGDGKASLWAWNAGTISQLFDVGDEEDVKDDDVDLSSFGHIVFRSKTMPDASDKYPKEVCYVLEPGSTTPMQITSGEGKDKDGKNIENMDSPHISSNGEWVVFDSKSMYGAGYVPGLMFKQGAFTSGVTTDHKQIWRYHNSGSIGDRYLASWVSQSANDYECSDPYINDAGDVVLFQVHRNGHKQLAIAMYNHAARWYTGYITNSTYADSTNYRRKAIACVNGAGGLPLIVFASKVEYSAGNNVADANSPYYTGAPASIEDCEGAAGSASGHWGLYLVTGLSDPFVKLVELGNGNFTHVEFSQDGREIAFTSNCTHLYYRLGDGIMARLPADSGDDFVNKRKAFRLRLNRPGTSGASITAIPSVVVPDDSADYQGGGGMTRVFIAR